MPAPEIKVIDGKAVIQASGNINLGDEVLYAGQLQPSADMLKALEGGYENQDIGIEDLLVTGGFKSKFGEAWIDQKGVLKCTLGTKVGLISSGNNLFAGSDRERLLKNPISDELNELVKYEAMLTPENLRESAVSGEVKLGPTLTLYTVSEDKQSLTATFADREKDFLCSLQWEEREGGVGKSDMHLYKISLKQGDRGVVLTASPDNKESYQVLGRFEAGEFFSTKGGVEITEGEIKEIMEINYSDGKVFIDFGVEVSKEGEFETHLRANIPLR